MELLVLYNGRLTYLPELLVIVQIEIQTLNGNITPTLKNDDAPLMLD